MAGALQRPCMGDSGRCGKLTTKRWCQAHERAVDHRRGSSASRGYDSRWRRYSLAFRREFPVCGMRPAEAPVTDDSVCARERRVRASTVTDHIVPVTGPNDKAFYDRANHQALCDECHNAKRQREAGAANG